MDWINLLFFTLACVVLSQSSSYLIKALAKISSFLKLNEFTIGFILVGVATSLPEMLIGIMSAINGIPEFSIGNVIGSNIVDITLVIGIGALLAKKIPVESKIVKKDLVYMLAIIFLPVILLLDHFLWHSIGLFPNMTQGLSRIDGVILLFAFVLYMYNMVKQESKFSKTTEKTTRKEVLKYFILFLVSLTLLLISSSYVVDYAKLLSTDMNLSPFLMGIFIISFGTSLPELTFTIKSVMSHYDSMAIGDIVGSVITNSTLVLGLTAVIMPVAVNPVIYMTSTLFMIFAGFIFLTFAESEGGISWNEGLSLVMLYFLFIIIETYLKSMSGAIVS